MINTSLKIFYCIFVNCHYKVLHNIPPVHDIPFKKNILLLQRLLQVRTGTKSWESLNEGWVKKQHNKSYQGAFLNHLCEKSVE